ncbi:MULTISPECIES: pantoate--beta-alanine ligase [Amniculibacterium]|jgi:pantoate--beta-alanine ligase|uniref:pantoate--beta-alanine ligase n=1 Tax=Amniculibacterium TaxID=2715289 RepID=UPI000F5A70C4|nr:MULTISPECIES: pantoate--beta-alanine ligase [Amniculibacterium]
MEIIKNRKKLQDYIERQKEMGKKIGFAPTMGALHDGHLSLYQKAREENDLVVSSIFVNPTQFNNAEDLEKYPRTVDRDIEKLKESALVDVVYLPEVEDIYPEKAKSKSYDFGGIEKEMEGASRPGHFDGVGTVVEELFRQVQPDQAYFGEKDFQQLAIIRELVRQLKLQIKIIGVPIFREQHGLAMSSRNERLTNELKLKAGKIHETLKWVEESFPKTPLPEIHEKVKEVFENDQDMELEYFIIADENNLKTATTLEKDKKYRAFIVVVVAGVRLIDNMGLKN